MHDNSFYFRFVAGPVRSNSTICAYVQRGVVKEMPLSKADSDKGSDTNVNNNGNPEVLSDNQTVRCTKATDKCYALYTEDPQNKSNILILAQGKQNFISYN